RQRLIALGQPREDAVHEPHDERDDPQRGEDRQPHEHACDQVASQAPGALRGAHLPLRGAGRAFDFAAGLARDFDAEVERDAPDLRESLPEDPLSELLASAAGFDSAEDFASVAFVSAFVSPDALLAGFESATVSGSFSTARLRLFSLSPLKSVSYQPPPFRRKTGADTSFFMVFLPQEGHFLSGASETFCSSSV